MIPITSDKVTLNATIDKIIKGYNFFGFSDTNKTQDMNIRSLLYLKEDTSIFEDPYAYLIYLSKNNLHIPTYMFVINGYTLKSIEDMKRRVYADIPSNEFETSNDFGMEFLIKAPNNIGVHGMFLTSDILHYYGISEEK